MPSRPPFGQGCDPRAFRSSQASRGRSRTTPDTYQCPPDWSDGTIVAFGNRGILDSILMTLNRPRDARPDLPSEPGSDRPGRDGGNGYAAPPTRRPVLVLND